MEYAFFSKIVKKLKQIKSTEIRLQAEWISTPKNQQVSRFYEDLGFSINSETDTSKFYQIPLNKYIARDIEYIEVLSEPENKHVD